MAVMGALVRVLLAVLILGAGSGCTYTVSLDVPPPIEPSPPSAQPAVEHTVAAFSFALGGGDMETSIFDGRQLSNEIMNAWKESGYIRSQQYVADAAFSGTADYHLTLRGRQRGETSWTMQILNALTLGLIPYTITQQYDFEYLLQNVKTGAQYTAFVHASDKTWVQPLLVFALPFHSRGHDQTMQRTGDYLYEHFRLQGAFTEPTNPPAEPETEGSVHLDDR